MITDHIATAKAIAKELGILEKHDKAITGKELDNIPQDKLVKRNKRLFSICKSYSRAQSKNCKSMARSGKCSSNDR